MKKLFTALSICVALSFAGCIDNEFNLADTSGEITIGGEELVVPLGDIGKISLDDLLGKTEGLTTNDNGVYQIAFSSFGDDPTKYEKVSVEGISIPNISYKIPELNPISFSMEQLPSTLNLSAIKHEFDVEFPSIGNIMTVAELKVAQDIAFGLPEAIKGQGTIDDMALAGLQYMGMGSISSEGKNEVVFDAKLSILEQLNKVDWVEFGCEDHPYGTPFEIDVDLNGLSDINGGGKLNLEVEFPHGYYLRYEDGSDFPQATHYLFSKEYEIAENQKDIRILLYLHRIDYSDHTFEDGKLKINDHINYSYNLNLNLGKGSYNLDQKPKITFEAAPKYKDVEVVINHFDIPALEQELSYTFDGMPSGVTIEKVAFTEDTKLNLQFKGLEWCVINDNITGDNISPNIEIDLPLCMHFRNHELLDTETNVLMASATQLAQGVTLSLEHIDCVGSESVKQENGQLRINEKIKAAVHMESLDGHTVLVSTLTPPSDLDVEVVISETQLKLDVANTKVSWSEDKAFDFNLGDNIPAISTSIDIPEMIAHIERIEIGKANSKEPLSMSFTLDAGKSFPVDALDINVSVNLGKMLHPAKAMFDEGLIKTNDNGDYILTIDETWHPSQAPLSKTLMFDAIENLPDVVNGKLALNQRFPITGSAKIKSGEEIDLSAVSDAKIDIAVALDDIEVRTFTGKVDLSVEPEPMFVELGLGEIGGIKIEELNPNPVLTLHLKDNPTGIGLSADVKITTYDKDNQPITTLNIPTISIAGNGASTIIISTPRNQEKYGKEGTFVAVENLSDILKQLPHKIGVELKAYTDKSQEVTLDLKEAAKGYNIEYQYEVLMPLEFDGDVNLAYETTVSGLNETFAELADTTNGLKVGDVGLIVDIDTTIPFNVVLSAELVNAEGTTEGIAARLNINDCVIKGYNKETDGEKKSSKIDLDFDLGESGSLEGLKSADGIRLKLAIYDADAEITELAKDQYISGKLKLRVRNGLTVDIFDFLNAEEE